MIIERTENEIIIRLSPTVNLEELQEMAKYFRYKEITSKYTTPQSVADQLASKKKKK